jgi:transposase
MSALSQGGKRTLNQELRMSRKERDRLKVIEQIERGLIGQAQGAEALGLSARQVRRLQARYRVQGDAGLAHRSRGRPSNRRIGAGVRAEALARIERRYRDFGPTLAAEYLAQEAGIEVSRETARGWMIEAGLWHGSRKKRPHRRRRPRRPCRGALVQMDTSIHDWFEGRGETAVLITMIDDATSHVEQRFFASDTTAANMAMIALYIERHGRPAALYTDRASHFTHTARRRRMLSEDPTQIERALGELDIRLIHARSPQAKGRVERRFGMDQDRMVKAMRLEGIATIEAANRFLDRTYLAQMNARFTRPAAGQADLHRNAQGYDLQAILSVQATRRVANDATVQFKGQVYQIEAGPGPGALAGARVTVERRLDGSLRLRWGGRYLGFKWVGPARGAAGRVGAIEPGEADPARGRPVGLRPPCRPRAESKKGKPSIPPHDHPWRRSFLPGKKPDNSTLR